MPMNAPAQVVSGFVRLQHELPTSNRAIALAHEAEATKPPYGFIPITSLDSTVKVQFVADGRPKRYRESEIGVLTPGIHTRAEQVAGRLGPNDVWRGIQVVTPARDGQRGTFRHGHFEMTDLDGHVRPATDANMPPGKLDAAFLDDPSVRLLVRPGQIERPHHSAHLSVPKPAGSSSEVRDHAYLDPTEFH
jgi:hypothetical protein